MLHEDLTGKHIQMGDIILYVEPGGGRGVPGLSMGRVVGLTKASVKVTELDPNTHRPKQYAEMIDDMSQPPRYISKFNGEKYYHKKATGAMIDNPPVAVKVLRDRFYITDIK